MSESPEHRLAWIGPDDDFPASDLAWTDEMGANGLLGAGDKLTSALLKRAYARGIFPWSGPSEPILWWSPNPRMVLQTKDFKQRRSLTQAIRQAQAEGFMLKSDTAFQSVMRGCAAPRDEHGGTWITTAIQAAYQDLHKQGLAHSIELWHGHQLVGGLYLVCLGQMVFGESMFSRRPNASKVCLAGLVRWLERHDCPLIDCQQETPHLATLGARPIPRAEFESCVARLTNAPGPPWATEPLDWGVFRGHDA